MDIEIRADRYEEEQKLARASYLLDQLVISQEEYDFLKEYDEALVVDFEEDMYVSKLAGYNYFNNGFEFKENLY
jgi:hypothetical protein